MKKLLIIILLFFATASSGCWDMRELNELGLVMAVGIDKSEDGEGFLVTVQVARPQEGGGTKSAGSGVPIWIGSAEGDTLFDAIRNIAQFSSRRIMWAHNNIIVIGEGVAEEGIEPVVDFFTHNPELRMKTWVAVSQGEASPIVAAQTGMEAIPAISLAQLFRYQELPAKSVNSDMVDLFRDYKSETTQPLLGVLRQITSKAGGNGEVELSGSAVIKDGKLAGWLSGEESRGLSWIRKEVDNAIISVSCGGDKKVKVSAELKQIDVKLQSFIDKDKLSMKVTVVALAHISEQDKPSNNSIDEFKAEVKDLLEKRVEKEMKHSLDMVQKDFESDVVFFGRVVHIQNKREWNSWIKDNWEEIFPSIPVEVKANIDVRSSTLYQIPMIEEKVGKESKDEGTDK